MKTHVNSLGKHVTVYIGETDQWRHQPLYMAILEFLRREGCARATVERGIAGFGANSRIKTTSLLDLSVDLPVTVTWVERPDRVERMDPKNHPGVLEYFMSKLPFGSLSTEARSPLQRARGKTAADLMTREVITHTCSRDPDRYGTSIVRGETHQALSSGRCHRRTGGHCRPKRVAQCLSR